jgi:hypothetical protein
MWLPKVERSPALAVPLEVCLALILNFLIALAVWPGFMSFDSLYALSELKHGVTSSAYPPMVSYMWYLPDLLIPGPGGMLLLQNGILLVAIALVFVCFRVSVTLSLGFLILFVATPIILGPMLVVWKDIGMSAFLAMSVALIAYASRRNSVMLLCLAFICLVVGGSYRLNAFPALFPLGLAALLVLREIWPKKPGRYTLPAVYAGGTIIALVLIVTTLSFRLPDLKPLPTTFNSGTTQLFDILGTSVCLQKNLVPEEFFLRPFSIDELSRVYKPQHAQMSYGDGNADFLQYQGFVKVPDLGQRWRQIVLVHPLCYLQHRLQVMSYLLGANREPVFSLTHPAIDPNDFGIKMQPTPLTDRVVQYVLGAAQPVWGVSNVLARGWVWGAVAAISSMWLLARRRPIRRFAVLIYLSGIFYLAGAFFVLPAADARYAHWFVVASFLVIALALIDTIVDIRERKRSR